VIGLSIVIVAWNVRDLLAACLESIGAGPVAVGSDAPAAAPDRLAVEVIVVDSASTDGTPDMLRERFAWVHLIEPGENVGFSRGNNIGLRASRGRFVMLLNPDTVVLDDALPRLVGYLNAHPDVGVVGPQLLNSDGSLQSSRRRFPTLTTAFFESTWLQPIAPRRMLTRYYFEDIPPDRTLDVDWLTGAALVTRREVIAQVGGLDEGYFMYSEELDWQRRIKGAGWRVVYLPGAQIVHHGGQSSQQVSAQTHIRFQSSKIRYFRKHHGELAALVLRIFLLFNYAWQLALEAIKGALGHKPEMRRARVRIYLQVLRSGLKAPH
jgi:N-acetylglucosaminyl-diphospho-decaprenol L-rhamnosyltransferase